MKIIAHRGASGYLPEHTLESKALAFAMGADFLEQDVVASRDGELIVLHDIHLDRVTDVATRFPGRAREDGRFYAIDFDLEELRTLRVTERVNAEGEAVYPRRFPPGEGHFGLHTLADELTFIAGLHASTGRRAGAYPEIKRPAFHRAEGVDISRLVLEVLEKHGYRHHDDPVFVQCFDASETRRIREEFRSKLPLIQLIGDNSWGESDTDYERLQTEEGIRQMAGLVDGFGPWINQLFVVGHNGKPRSSGLVERMHAAGCEVHPYTLRRDDLPPAFEDFGALLAFLRDELGVDAVFTDFPDLARRQSGGG